MNTRIKIIKEVSLPPLPKSDGEYLALSVAYVSEGSLGVHPIPLLEVCTCRADTRQAQF